MEWHNKVRDFARLILHGDKEHKQWLLESAERFIEGKYILPVCPGQTMQAVKRADGIYEVIE